MIKVNLITVGSLKEKYWVEAEREYVKRLGAYAKVNLIEVKESLLPKNASKAQILKAKQEEANKIKEKAKGYLIALEVKGKNFTSEQFAKKFETLSVEGNSEITFIIGGSNGLYKAFSDSCNLKMSFSSFTYPHQLMKIILLEQVYRAFCIINNKTYHK